MPLSRRPGLLIRLPKAPDAPAGYIDRSVGALLHAAALMQRGR